MKKFETPVLNVEKFDLVNIVTTSGETPVEPAKVSAADLAQDAVNASGAVATFTITL